MESDWSDNTEEVKFVEVEKPKSNVVLSIYQEAILNSAKNGLGNVLVEALAGSGKTKTMIDVAEFSPKGLSIIFFAFGKRISEELQKKTNIGEIKTIHSFGLKCLYKSLGKDVIFDNDKVHTLIDKTIGKKIKNKEVIYNLIDAVTKAKDNLASTKEDVSAVMDRFEIDNLDMPEADFINNVLFLMNLSKKYNKIVDFTDEIWLPNVLPNVKIQQYDRVLIDEGQDLSPGQIELVLKAAKPNGRTFVFADRNQAIYQFRSADGRAVDKFKERLNAQTYPLPITYRCPISVVKKAQELVPALEIWEKAIEGEVKNISYTEMLKQVAPGCVILSRYNAPLMTLAMKLISEKKPCNIQGRDLGQNIKGMIKHSRCKSIESFLVYLDKWKNREYSKLIARKKDPTGVMDKYQCLTTLAASCDDVNEMKDQVDNLFLDGDNNSRIMLSNGHQFKGLQSPTVYVLMNTLRYNTEEERNVSYVILTRCQNTQYLVTKEKTEKKKKEDLDRPKSRVKSKKSDNLDLPDFDMSVFD